MNDNNLIRLKQEVGIDNIYKDYIDGDKNIFKRIINKIKRIRLNNILKSSDVTIIIGGDDISEYYGLDALLQELKKLKEESLNKKVILLGQTIGPFTEDRGKLACECLCNTKIYTRDDNCYKYLEELNFKNIKRGRDLAFLQLPMQMKAKYILKKYDLQENEYVTIVPSGLSKSYTENFDDYIEEQLNIISNLIENKRIKDNYDIEIAFIEGITTKIISYSTNKNSKKYAWVHIDLEKKNYVSKFYKNKEEQIKSYEKFDKIFCVSDDVRDSFTRVFGINNNVITQYNPVDEIKIRCLSTEKIDDVDINNKFKIITVGRLEPQKGFDRLLKIHKRLIEEGFDYELWILGEGIQKNR